MYRVAILISWISLIEGWSSPNYGLSLAGFYFYAVACLVRFIFPECMAPVQIRFLPIGKMPESFFCLFVSIAAFLHVKPGEISLPLYILGTALVAFSAGLVLYRDLVRLSHPPAAQSDGFSTTGV